MSKPVSFAFTKPKWKVREDTKVFETPIFSLQQIKLIPDQKRTPSDFYVLDAPEWVNIIAMTPEKEVLLVEQYRAGIDAPTLEIPGGMVDKGEGPLDAAKRELLEETGFESNDWSTFGKISANPAIQNNFTHLYLALDCIKTKEQQMDGTEDILMHQMPLERFLQLIKKGIVHHSIVLAAVTHLLLHEVP